MSLHSVPPIVVAAPTRILFSFMLLGCVLAGCGPSGPAVEFVEGVVLLDGSPVEDCVVGFSPLDPGGISAFGQTDGAGVFRLTSSRGGKPARGAVPGRYAISITKQKPRDRPPGSMQASGPDDIIFLVPRGYAQADTSGLAATVRKGRNVGPEFRFELKSDYKPAVKAP